jgi:hypothetical protein
VWLKTELSELEPRIFAARNVFQARGSCICGNPPESFSARKTGCKQLIRSSRHRFQRGEIIAKSISRNGVLEVE